jgi:hypothetical protein
MGRTGVGRGPVVAAGVQERKRERQGIGGVPTCGPGWHSAGRRGSNWIWNKNLNSNGSKHFQTVSKFGRLEKYFSLLGKIEIKYCFEALEEGNNFLRRNFLRFRNDMELKFREVCMSWKQGKNHWINLELWNLMKFCWQAPCYTLLQRKMNFQQKRIINLIPFEIGIWMDFTIVWNLALIFNFQLWVLDRVST